MSEDSAKEIGEWLWQRVLDDMEREQEYIDSLKDPVASVVWAEDEYMPRITNG
jgi:hypothetical protein